MELPGKRTAVVTGAAGFIGNHLSERLLSGGWHVRGLDNERSGDWSRVSDAVERVERDLCDLSPSELRDLCAGAEVVFHLAAEKYNTSRTTPERVIAVNIAATQRLFEAATAAGAKVVFTSSLYAYGGVGPAPMVETDVPKPATTYGMSKMAGEHLLRVARRDGGLRWTVLRLFFIYGPRQHAEGGYKSVIVKNFERLHAGEPPVINGDGEQALDYVFVDDCLAALETAADGAHDGALYNVATGRGITINALTELMLDVSGSSLEPVPAPADWTQGTIRVGSPERAAQKLGWRATTSIRDGLEAVWRFQCSN